MGDNASELISEIEKAKNEAIIQLSKCHDEKLKFHFDIIRYTTWLITILGGVFISTIAYVGFKGYKDIISFVEEQSKIKAESVINSREFQLKIDSELGKVVQTRLEKMNEIDHKIDILQNFLKEKDQKNLINSLFNTLDPRLLKIEAMEQGAKVNFHKDNIVFTSSTNNGNLAIYFGAGLLKMEGTKQFRVEVNGNSQYFCDKKFIFPQRFVTPPIVFLQPNFIPNGLQMHWAISAVNVDTEGFFVNFIQTGRRESPIFFHPSEIQFSYLAMGQPE